MEHKQYVTHLLVILLCNIHPYRKEIITLIFEIAQKIRHNNEILKFYLLPTQLCLPWQSLHKQLSHST